MGRRILQEAAGKPYGSIHLFFLTLLLAVLYGP